MACGTNQAHHRSFSSALAPRRAAPPPAIFTDAGRRWDAEVVGSSVAGEVSVEDGEAVAHQEDESPRPRATPSHLHLTILQRLDPAVEDILITAAHVTLYDFNINLNQRNGGVAASSSDVRRPAGVAGGEGDRRHGGGGGGGGAVARGGGGAGRREGGRRAARVWAGGRELRRGDLAQHAAGGGGGATGGRRRRAVRLARGDPCQCLAALPGGRQRGRRARPRAAHKQRMHSSS